MAIDQAVFLLVGVLLEGNPPGWIAAASVVGAAAVFVLLTRVDLRRIQNVQR